LDFEVSLNWKYYWLWICLSCNQCFCLKHIERFKNKFWETNLEEVYINRNQRNDKYRGEEYSFNSGYQGFHINKMTEKDCQSLLEFLLVVAKCSKFLFISYRKQTLQKKSSNWNLNLFALRTQLQHFCEMTRFDEDCKSPCDAIPECDEKDLEAYLMNMCFPTLAVQCTFQGSELLSRRCFHRCVHVKELAIL
jgi:hypothetical protein